MVYSKSFPRTIEGSNYPRWEEVFLTEQEERQVDEKARKENVSLLKECIVDAKRIFAENGLKDYQSDLITMAIALYEKRASHTVYHKETLAKEKFEKVGK